jgi:hypothetical protein
MSSNDKTPEIFSKLGPKDRGILTKQKEIREAEQSKADNMSSEQTLVYNSH